MDFFPVHLHNVRKAQIAPMVFYRINTHCEESSEGSRWTSIENICTIKNVQKAPDGLLKRISTLEENSEVPGGHL